MKIKALDIVIIVTALLLSAVLFFVPFMFRKTPESLTVIVKNGNASESFTYSLDEDTRFTFENNGITLTVVIEGGAAYVAESNCDCGICKNTPKISRAGQSIVCAPAGVALILTGGDADADAVAW